MSDKPLSPLRQRMIDDMTARRFKEKVQKDYVRQRQDLRGLPRPVAGHGHERGPSPRLVCRGEDCDAEACIFGAADRDRTGSSTSLSASRRS